MTFGWRAGIDRLVAAAIGAGRWLVLPLALLLFLQWPLRDIVQAHSREANDLAQWLFALYVSLAMTFATRERAHLAADTFARRYRPSTRAVIDRFGALVCVAPWALFILVGGGPTIWQSVRQLEGFPDTFNPGYFIVKASAWILALLALLQALLDATRPMPAR